MAFLRRGWLALSFLLLAAGVAASPTLPREGVEFLAAKVAQPAPAGKKIEVIEVFGYYCPHCNAFEPALAAWRKKNAERIVFRRIHVVFRAGMLPFQQMYLTLESMGKTEQVHEALFDAMHVRHLPLASEPQLLDFVVSKGIDKSAYLEIYQSSDIAARMLAAARAQEAFGIDSVPMLVVDGRFVTSPELLYVSLGEESEPLLHRATLQVLDSLLARVARERATAARLTTGVIK